LQPRLVDGLGVGDVGHAVLSDRQALGREGMVVLVIPRHDGVLDTKNLTVVSRGFVFMQQAQEVVEFLKQTTAEIVAELGPNVKDDEIKRALEKRIGRKLNKIIRRTPMILPVIIEV